MWIKVVQQIKRIPTVYLIALFGAILYIPFLGHVPLFDWDEINFAEAAREMIITKSYSRVSINYEPFWEKPPLFIWMQVLSMRVFGVTEFAARFPNAICGILTLLVLYKAGEKFISKQMAILWVLLYTACLLPHAYFKSGIIDPFFNLFIFCSILFLIQLTLDEEWYQHNALHRYRIQRACLSGVFAGLAILVKGPVAIILITCTFMSFFLVSRFRRIIKPLELIAWLLCAIFVAGSWFAIETVLHGTWFIKTFIEYQIRLFSTKDAGHGGFLLYHFVVVLLGCFPASSFIFAAKPQSQTYFNTKQLIKWMWVLLCVVLLLFTIVKTKIIHYSSLSYFPLSFLAAYSLFLWIDRKRSLMRIEIVFFVLTATIWLLLLFIVPYMGSHIHMFDFLFQKDVFAQHNIQAQVYWSYIDYIPFVLATLAILLFVLLSKFRHLSLLILLLGNTLAISLALTLFAPKIERYTQHSAIEFYKQKAKEKAKVDVYGYKSYAHLFYTNRMPADTLSPKRYIVAKITQEENAIKELPLHRLFEKNGYVFFEYKNH